MDLTNVNNFSSILSDVGKATIVVLNIASLELSASEVATVRANDVKVIGNLDGEKTTISCGEGNAHFDLR